MTQPDFFSRPEEWTRLEGSEAGDRPAPPASEPPSGSWWRGRFKRRPKHRGLGSRPAGPDFSWPSAPIDPASRPLPPTRSSLGWEQPPPENAAPDRPSRFGRRKGAAGSPRNTAAAAGTRASRQPTVKPAARRVRPGRSARPAPLDALLGIVRGVGLFALAVFVVIAMLNALVEGLDRSRRTPVPTRPPGAPAQPAELPAAWSLKATELRPELAAAEVVSSVDGAFDENRLVDAGDSWVVLTGDADDRRIAVHGIDRATGRPVWRKDLPDGLCAARLLGSGLLCAASTGTDPATGLGTRWRISVLDPATGRERRGTDFAGWLTLLHVDGDRVLLVEQRQPAPHAVLTVLDADLRQRGRLDLRDQPQHAGLFSDNRIYDRKLPIPAGPALDRPRIRKVADGLTALWVGQTTVFVDLRSGRLAGMPRCSRLVDDGERLWCNDGPLAVAYDYRLRRRHETALNTRLAFPDRDPRAGDITDPVFVEANGRAVRVDPATGKTLGPLAQTRNGSAFGMTVSPKAAFVEGLTLLSDSSILVAVNARTGAARWNRDKPASLGDAWAWRGKLLFAGSVVRVLDPADGREQAAYRQRHGLYTVVVADTLVGIGPDELARLADP